LCQGRLTATAQSDRSPAPAVAGDEPAEQPAATATPAEWPSQLGRCLATLSRLAPGAASGHPEPAAATSLESADRAAIQFRTDSCGGKSIARHRPRGRTGQGVKRACLA